MTAKCEDCGRDYGVNGWGDFVIPHWQWRRISPTGNSGGILCVCCMCDRLHKAAIRCEGAFVSGPIRSVSYDTMTTMLRCENIEERLGAFDTRIPASVIEARRADTPQSESVEDESAVAASQTPKKGSS